jgi:hypothetical protein
MDDREAARLTSSPQTRETSTRKPVLNDWHLEDRGFLAGRSRPPKTTCSAGLSRLGLDGEQAMALARERSFVADQA